ncbi:MAG: IS1595 family transposase [Sinimarinibacterium flocculans]|uniref:IS1595 family transposase n=1 Tax=Sinimarinibacterium flocculans TaxID=985250 RepID=UPI003C3E07A0
MTDLTAPHFTDADKAREYLEALRWPNGVTCPHCGAVGEHYQLQGKAHRPGLWKCKDCREQFSVTVGTVFESSKVALNKWLLAVHLMCASKKGISAHQVHRMLGVTYKTAWFMCHRIREAMKDENGGLLGGNGGAVEVDETYWGTSKPKGKTARGYAHKMKVVSLVERDGKKRSFRVANVDAKTLRPILKSQLSDKARLMTDEASAYTKVGREFAEHGVVVHSAKEYARGDVTTNTVESSFALLKRGLTGTFHKVSEAHLQRYATEFDFRWNHRAKMGYTDDMRAEALLGQVGGKRLTYKGPHSQEATHL